MKILLVLLFLSFVLSLVLSGCGGGSSGPHHDDGPDGPVTYLTYSGGDVTDALGTSSSAGFKPTEVRLASDGEIRTTWVRNAGTLMFSTAVLPNSSHGWVMYTCTVTDDGPAPGDKTLHVVIENHTTSGEGDVDWTFILSAPTASG